MYVVSLCCPCCPKDVVLALVPGSKNVGLASRYVAFPVVFVLRLFRVSPFFSQRNDIIGGSAIYPQVVTKISFLFSFLFEQERRSYRQSHRRFTTASRSSRRGRCGGDSAGVCELGTSSREC